jgi:hypothetical protein
MKLVDERGDNEQGEVSRPLLDGDALTTEQAFELFDSLPAVDMGFMWGRWKGTTLRTGHRMDDLLETFNWYGKEFIDPENVNPLLFRDWGGRIFTVYPNRLLVAAASHVPIPRSRVITHLFLGAKWLMLTRKPRARLRMTEFRGVLSATMIYDHLPINDVFRRLDEHTVLGVMDLKGAEQPFFFTLTRDDA